LLDEKTDPKLRKQILTYHLSGVMTDRERAELLGLPKGCRIRENAKIISPEKLKCGKNVWIGEGAILDASGGLEIGDNTQIGLYTLVWSHSSHAQALAGETGSSRDKIVRKATKIGKNTFIGGPSVIYPGVTIGNRVVILPMSVITKDVPDDSVTNGGPMERIRELENKVKELTKMVETCQKRSSN
jgi:acetyltransferase-like isoleucine patch superfamily enzyme